ncbi:MAG: hypothetical protein FJ096_04190 [Deltaproteobacteria bacterium]|nr:hypothetical protein [Deltaproteobacteria bacterium]
MTSNHHDPAPGEPAPPDDPGTPAPAPPAFQPFYAPPRSGPARAKEVARKLNLGAAVVAVVYGLAARIFFGLGLGAPSPTRDVAEPLFVVMSLGFIFGVPLVIGFLASYLSRQERLLKALTFPIVPALVALGVSLLLAFEGLICIMLWLPLFIGLSALGGLVGWIAVKVLGDRRRGQVLAIAVALPVGVGATERILPRPDEARHVATSIAIEADPASVWEEIVEVPAIRPEEHGFSWSHVIGFPRPVAATVDGRGVGSTREATFERGVLFIERVTEFDADRLLSFSIHADAASIPARALDEHVTVGGPYFDVLRGTYRIEPRSEGGVVLHLSSDHRLSTRFNGYAGMWTDFIMRDTQRHILRVVARRAEARARAGTHAVLASPPASPTNR